MKKFPVFLLLLSIFASASEEALNPRHFQHLYQSKSNSQLWFLRWPVAMAGAACLTYPTMVSAKEHADKLGFHISPMTAEIASALGNFPLSAEWINDSLCDLEQINSWKRLRSSINGINLLATCVACVSAVPGIAFAHSVLGSIPFDASVGTFGAIQSAQGAFLFLLWQKRFFKQFEAQGEVKRQILRNIATVKRHFIEHGETLFEIDYVTDKDTDFETFENETRQLIQKLSSTPVLAPTTDCPSTMWLHGKKAYVGLVKLGTFLFFMSLFFYTEPSNPLLAAGLLVSFIPPVTLNFALINFTCDGLFSVDKTRSRLTQAVITTAGFCLLIPAYAACSAGLGIFNEGAPLNLPEVVGGNIPLIISGTNYCAAWYQARFMRSKKTYQLLRFLEGLELTLELMDEAKLATILTPSIQPSPFNLEGP